MTARMNRGSQWLAPTVLAMALAATLPGCAGLPPGAHFPRVVSVRLPDPETTRIGGQVAVVAREHGGLSGLRIITRGVDGLLLRAQMIDAAERTLDLQYYIFHGDTSGQLLTAALHRAAARGVRVRVLVDDADTMAGDEQLLSLLGQASAELRLFNPFVYRGHADFPKAVEFLFNFRRLDYRMHNKLMVVDGAVALVGGRNIGDQYFQIDPETQFADDDVFVLGPVANELDATFDEYWNSGLAIPAAAVARRRVLPPATTPTADFAAQIATGEPFAGMMSGRLPLVWARARVVCDSPEKKKVVNGTRAGRLMNPLVLEAANAAHTELLMVTPYFIPAVEETRLLHDLRQRQVRVRILTNSLEAAPAAFAQAGYTRHRLATLREGVELYEARSLLGSARGSGQTTRISRFGNYSLHAKLFVFDSQQLFIGSMNFDKRSKHLNTEVGLIIDSPALAAETAARFAAMVQPQNSYVVTLQPQPEGRTARLSWHTEEYGDVVDLQHEPARSGWQRFEVALLSHLPMGNEQ
jgi:cardiolipin synthase C